MKRYRTIYGVLSLVGGAAIMLMDVRLTNEVLFSSAVLNDQESFELVGLQLDGKVVNSSSTSILGTNSVLSNRSIESTQTADGVLVEHVRIAGIGNSTTPNHTQPAEDVVIERADVASVVDTHVHQRDNAGDTIALTLSKGYPLNTNSSIVTTNGIKELRLFSYWGRNKYCKVLRKLRPSLHPIVFNITFGCQDLFSISGFGTGNWISALYGIRMAALANGGADVRFTCPDAEDTKRDLIIPWLMGYFPGHDVSRHDNLTLPTMKDACEDYDNCPIGHMIPFMRKELRRMAIALVGIPGEDHPSREYADRVLWSDLETSKNLMQVAAPKDTTPLYPDIELDDVVAHFRCGDIIKSTHRSFGFMKFSAYIKLMLPETESIGIITQPFELTNQSRSSDATKGRRRRCKELVSVFVDQLSESFPKARIRIHNGPNETIALAYARMIMAKQAIVGIGTFGVFPAIATFGTGYIRKPDYTNAPNGWLLSPPVDEHYANVVLFDEPNRLMTYDVTKLRELPGGDENVLDWFRNDTYCIDKCIV